MKKLNRRCELTAPEAEIFAVLAGPFGFKMPQEKLTEAWKAVLVNQFHDILPGSHPNPVAVEAQQTYQDALATFGQIRQRAQQTIAEQAQTNQQPGKPWVVYNSLNWQRDDLVKIPLEGKNGGKGRYRVVDAAGQVIASQVVREDGGQAFLLFVAKEIPSVGYRVFYLQESAAATPNSLETDELVLENSFFRLQLDDQGRLVSLLDKRHHRQVIAAGQVANKLQLFEDKHGIYDAWDIVAHFQDKSWDIDACESIAVVETGPVRAAIRIVKKFFNSRLVQHVYLYNDLPRVDFNTVVDWHEHNKLLKVLFPVSVLARRVACDLSFGHIHRPTHTNTSWDRAKFEVNAHQWVDLSEAHYGVSLLNDCKYGHDIRENRLRLTLLRGPIRPDPDSDQGMHEFTYSLYPHAGTLQEGQTVAAAHQLNSPLTLLPTSRHEGTLADCHSFLAIDNPGVFLTALKSPEEGAGAILRVVEVHGGRGMVRIRTDLPARTIEECDLLERTESRLKGKGEFEILPFQIRTFRLGK